MAHAADTSSARFRRDFKKLDRQQREAFLDASAKLIHDLGKGIALRASLKVKRVVNSPGVWEFAWAYNGRATFSYSDTGTEILMRRVGTHDIFRRP